jgi:hypothetical protein
LTAGLEKPSLSEVEAASLQLRLAHEWKYFKSFAEYKTNEHFVTEYFHIYEYNCTAVEGKVAPVPNQLSTTP